MLTYHHTDSGEPVVAMFHAAIMVIYKQTKKTWGSTVRTYVQTAPGAFDSMTKGSLDLAACDTTAEAAHTRAVEKVIEIASNPLFPVTVLITSPGYSSLLFDATSGKESIIV